MGNFATQPSKSPCYGCGEIFHKYPRSTSRICASCCSKKMNAQADAKAKITSAKRRGLPPARVFACQDCGEPARVWDHRDYRKPLHVDAVCIACNLKRGPGVWDDRSERVLRAVK